MSDAKQGSSRGGQRSGSSRKKKSRKKKVDPKAFWGTPDSLPTPESIDTETLEPVAVVASLGNPPIPGQQAASQHYFRMVYDRASQLGLALGHAGGLDDLAADEDEDLDDAADVEIGNRITVGDDELAKASQQDDELRERNADEMAATPNPDSGESE